MCLSYRIGLLDTMRPCLNSLLACSSRSGPLGEKSREVEEQQNCTDRRGSLIPAVFSFWIAFTCPPSSSPPTVHACAKYFL